MAMPVLATKLFMPPPRPKLVLRPRLVERLNEGLQGKLILISAPAGFGKTTLISEWISGCGHPVAWVSLDERDDDPSRFLTYFISALQTIDTRIGKGMVGGLQTSQPQPAPTESTLTILLNEINTVSNHFILVLDDYHVIESQQVDNALAFLLKQLPPQMHLVIATREDPDLPLARLRASGQLTELRAADLRFTSEEAAGFLNQVMGLNLPTENITALETRTEGWITGLQLAAISMQGTKDTAGFIKSFTGSHHFVLDYLVEEILQHQPGNVQNFLLCTSILDRMCGPLCDTVLNDPSISGQEMLEYMEHANLFLTPLDNERRWYRYQHLFADLLRQQLRQSTSTSTEERRLNPNELHRRASQWYEDNGLEIEAFHHAAAANDFDRAERLIEGNGMPLHYRGAMAPVIRWLESLPRETMDARPSLWVTYASAVMLSGNPLAVEEMLQSAEAGLAGLELNEKNRDLEGQIAGLRALVASSQNQIDTIMVQSRRALELLRPDNLPIRTAINFSLGYAHLFQGDRVAASRAFTEVLSAGQASGNFMFTIAAAVSLGGIQEEENQLHQAVETYRKILQMVGDPSHMAACEAYYGLARRYYEWNELDAAWQNCLQAAELAQQVECMTPIPYEVLKARLNLARGDSAGALDILTKASELMLQQHLGDQMSDIAAAQVVALLHQDNLIEAAHVAQKYENPVSLARVYLARGDAAAALTLLEPQLKQAKEKGSPSELLKVIVLQALAFHANGETDKAVGALGEALAMAEPGGFTRTFVDEGAPMAQLLSEVSARGILPGYVSKLLASFDPDEVQLRVVHHAGSFRFSTQPLIEPLSPRELEVLRLIALGLSNREISERLFLALSTVKGHSRIIFDKLQVQRRTEAVARARELGLL
jgi:LuxR family transcriptional regulator, maltose regulon positive regulatory protein